MEEDSCADFTDQQNKMFVGGLAQTVTSDFLKAYFSSFGVVQDAFVLMDEQSGRSRGFGFVTFDNPQTLKMVLKQKPHILGNKQVDCKHAVNKNVKQRPTPASSAKPNGTNNNANGLSVLPASQPPNVNQSQSLQADMWPYDILKSEDPELLKDDVSPFSGNAAAGAAEWSDNDSADLFLTGGGRSYLALSGDKWLEDCEEADARKIFVGGLPDITPLEFAKYFEHFGPVADAMVMYDRKRRRQRGFGFITFASDDGVRNSLNFSRHPVKGKVVEVKKAHPLILQKARAPAKQELEAERAAQQRGMNARNTNSASGGSGHGGGNGGQMMIGGGSDPFGISGSIIGLQSTNQAALMTPSQSGNDLGGLCKNNNRGMTPSLVGSGPGSVLMMSMNTGGAPISGNLAPPPMMMTTTSSMATNTTINNMAATGGLSNGVLTSKSLVNGGAINMTNNAVANGGMTHAASSMHNFQGGRLGGAGNGFGLVDPTSGDGIGSGGGFCVGNFEICGSSGTCGPSESCSGLSAAASAGMLGLRYPEAPWHAP